MNAEFPGRSPRVSKGLSPVQREKPSLTVGLLLVVELGLNPVSRRLLLDDKVKIGNWQLAIGNRQSEMIHRQLAI